MLVQLPGILLKSQSAGPGLVQTLKESSKPDREKHSPSRRCASICVRENSPYDGRFPRRDTSSVWYPSWNHTFWKWQWTLFDLIYTGCRPESYDDSLNQLSCIMTNTSKGTIVYIIVTLDTLVVGRHSVGYNKKKKIK